MGVPAGRVGRQ